MCSQVGKVVDLNRVEDYAIHLTSPSKEQCSPLDDLIQTVWKEKMQNGSFRYKLQHPSCKKLPGHWGYLAQFNSFRASSRRPPQAMVSVRQPFDPEKFNFTKVEPDKELVFETQQDKEDICIINVSPIEFGHCLFLPQVRRCLPQALTRYAIEAALKLMLLSKSKAMKMGFNSLCAYASVNHLHWHLYYLQDGFEVPTAWVQGSPLTAEVYELIDYPAKGFALELNSVNQLDRVADNVYKIVDYLHHNEIAHNVFITRGRCLSSKSKGSSIDPDSYEVIRVIIWARESVFGRKPPGDFCIAVCELAGQMLIYNEEAFNEVSETEVTTAHKASSQHQTVKPAILKLFEN